MSDFTNATESNSCNDIIPIRHDRPGSSDQRTPMTSYTQTRQAVHDFSYSELSACSIVTRSRGSAIAWSLDQLVMTWLQSSTHSNK